jgi:hypothetical protein
MAIRKANKLNKETKYKCIVLPVAGKPRVYTKFQLKYLIRRGFFKKGVTIQHLEKLALYITA